MPDLGCTLPPVGLLGNIAALDVTPVQLIAELGKVGRVGISLGGRLLVKLKGDAVVEGVLVCVLVEVGSIPCAGGGGGGRHCC